MTEPDVQSNGESEASDELAFLEPEVLTARHLVLLEGKDDFTLIIRMLDHLNLADFYVVNLEGVSKDWSLALKVLLKQPAFLEHGRSVTIIRDADASFSRSFESSQRILKANSLAIPSTNAEIAETGGLRSSIFIMPGGNRSGSLEDLLMDASNQERLDLASKFLTSIEEAHLPGPRNSGKGKIGAYHASLPRSPSTPALAIRQSQYDLSHEAFAELSEMLKLLASD